MSVKAPLSERNMELPRKDAASERWLRKGDLSLLSQQDEGRSKLTVRTGRAPYGKRGRDAAPRTWQRPKQTGSPSRHKKSRSVPAVANVQKQAPFKGPRNGGLPKGKGLERRVGGVAPNGNPQCWYAPNESEGDPHRLAQRLKQIEYGKNSEGYKAYIAAVPQ
jgi:hypothetical protein